MKSVEVTDEIYYTIQKLKEIFYKMYESDKKGLTPQETFTDENIIEILIGGFIDTLNADMSRVQRKEEEEWN